MGRVLLGLLILLGACSLDLAAPGEGASLEFAARAAQHGQWLEQPIVQATGESGRIVVNAKLSAADPCHTLAGVLEGTGSELTLRVSVARDQSQGCYQIIGTFEYDAVIRDLAPGSYRLRVIHSYAECCWPTVTALDHTLQVQ
ncbi:MAG: hypothetical protein H0W11_10875 [Gemmatimonadetes bacterium]|nr:hypothetical protein [Gemmatimonadota bacterium]